nr:hypothetical protein CFP56_02989 [Quercus suber]
MCWSVDHAVQRMCGLDGWLDEDLDSKRIPSSSHPTLFIYSTPGLPFFARSMLQFILPLHSQRNPRIVPKNVKSLAGRQLASLFCPPGRPSGRLSFDARTFFPSAAAAAPSILPQARPALRSNCSSSSAHTRPSTRFGLRQPSRTCLRSRAGLE